MDGETNDIKSEEFEAKDMERDASGLLEEAMAREPLLKRRTNITSQIAIVGANVCPIESLDYEIVENELFRQDWRSRKKTQILQYVGLKWSLALLIGLGTGLVGFFNNLAFTGLPLHAFIQGYLLEL